MVNIAWFKDLNKDSIPIAGGKGSNLGEMYNSGIPVPPGFAVTAQAYKEFLDSTGIQKEINEILKNLNVNDSEDLHASTKRIREIILNHEMSPTLKSEILEAYENLNVDKDLLKAGDDILNIVKSGREQAFVAVRSSATAEDLPEASFAGQQDTHLNIKGNKNLVETIKKCWSSLYTARATFYREKNNFPHEKVLISIIVQKMVDSDKAGVMFSANPTNNDRSEILIEAGYGLGEAVVSGSINPDLYILDKESLEVKTREIKKQSMMITKDVQTGETVKKKVPPEMQEKQVLTEDEIQQLGKLAVKLEDHYEKAQDIEFAIDKKVHIVQSRPVTTLKKQTQTEELKGHELTKGLTASPGVASGPVRIVNSEEDFSKVEKGDILVTKMTNPTMVPLMEKAAGIITNEGGSSSHAAIVSRELGTPCIVGTENATEVLNNGMLVTIDASHGKIFKGEIKGIKEEKVTDTGEGIQTKTKIYMNLGQPEAIDRYSKLNIDGIGLMRLEFIIAGLGEHPNAFIKNNKQDEYINGIYEGIKKVALKLENKPLVVRFSDFKSNEYRDLKDGSEYEPKEQNPMIGWRGVSRYVSDDFKEAFKLECKAIIKVRKECKNVHVMLPFVRNVEEVNKVLAIMKEENLERSNELKVWLMAEVPAMALIPEKFAELDIDGISMGNNDLTQLVLGVDRDSELLGKMGYFNSKDPAVMKAMENLIKAFTSKGKTVSSCGQAASDLEVAKFLVKTGATSVSVNPDTVGKMRRTIKELEDSLNTN